MSRVPRFIARFLFTLVLYFLITAALYICSLHIVTPFQAFLLLFPLWFVSGKLFKAAPDSRSSSGGKKKTII